MKWEDASRGSYDKMCLTSDSKEMLQACSRAMDDLNTVVANAVKDVSDKENVSQAIKEIRESEGDVVIHP
eukprot:4282295-Pyramimonas_sp.AAC.1